MSNEEDRSQLRDMSLEQANKMTIFKLQDQVRRLTNQIAQVREAMREPPYF